jgi:hypothetical protein
VTAEIPLFPLDTVLFPGGRLMLRIFEVRYLDMISRCLQLASNFGVVAIKQGTEVGAADTFNVGTLAEIVDWRRERDGLLGITAAGRTCFEIAQVSRQHDGLYVGRVMLRDAEAAVPLPHEYEPLASLLRKLLPLVAGDRDVAAAYDDASWVVYRLAEVLALPTVAKQLLLETRDVHARLQKLRALVRATEGPGRV